MRNKPTIIFLLVVFSLICLMEIFFTVDYFRVSSELDGLDSTARAERLKDKSFKDRLRRDQRHSFSLGLDLQGGMFVTMEVNIEDLIRQLAGKNALNKPEFEKAMASAKTIKTTSNQSLVSIFIDELLKTGTDVKLNSYFKNEEAEIHSNTANNVVIDYLLKKEKESVDLTFNVIRTRVDQFGVTAPNLTKETGSGRILLELPGIKDADRVKKLLQNTAKLEFWECHGYNDGWKVLEKVNNFSKRLKGLEKDTTAADTSKVAAGDTSKADTSKTAVADTTKQDTGAAGVASIANLGKTSATSPADTNDTNAVAATDSTKKDSLSLEEFKAQNPFAGLIQGLRTSTVNSPLLGYVHQDDTAEVMRYLRHPDIQRDIPANMMFLFEAKPITEEEELFGLVVLKTNKERKAPLEGGVINDARQDFDNGNVASPSVSMSMNTQGAQKWSKLTGDNVGKHIAIVLDNKVYSYPVVNGRITGGNSQISGSFDVDEAKDLANVLKAGELPLKAEIKGAKEIGPSLGQENLSRGLMSFVIAFLVTIAFMAFYYRGSGLIANIALVINLIYIFGISAAFNIVFTLPGIAALVFTMGAAVDANVLIFERVREELEGGKSLRAAVNAGFSNAFSSIIDSQITAFLSGVILYAFGIGPIKGFAVFLMIGIITSLIAALFISRIILEWWLGKGKTNISFGNPFTTRMFRNIDIKMVQRKKMFYAFSGTLLVGSIISILAFGFQLGVDFKGGYQFTVAMNQEVDPESLRNPLAAALGGGNVIIKQVDNEKTLMVTTAYMIESTDTSAPRQVRDAMVNAINGVSPNAVGSVIATDQVDASVATDIKTSAIFAVLFTLIVIFAYILFRFRSWQFSLGAVLALFHDVVIVCGVFSVLGYLDIMPFSLEVDQAFIAAALTIIGYSLTDTVVVYDRVRENLREMKTQDQNSVFSISINQTLSRTLITSLTILLTVIVLFIFGGEVIRPFAFALIIGIAFGTYSSIFVASALSMDLLKKRKSSSGSSVAQTA